MKPRGQLMIEHRLIEKFLAFAAEATKTMKDSSYNPVLIDTIVDFIKTYADRTHHGKEEDLLFPLLEARGVPATGCPLEALLHEHQTGRTLVANLEEATQAYAVEDSHETRIKLAMVLRQLMKLYPAHIWKEDYLAFPMTNKVLSAEDQQSLRQMFADVDVAIGQDVLNKQKAWAESLSPIKLKP